MFQSQFGDVDHQLQPLDGGTMARVMRDINDELADLMVDQDEQVEYAQRVEGGLHREAIQHYVRTRIHAGDKDHEAVGPNPLEDLIVLPGLLSPEPMKNRIKAEVRKLSPITRMHLTPRPVDRCPDRGASDKFGYPHHSVLFENGSFWDGPSKVYPGRGSPDAAVWI